MWFNFEKFVYDYKLMLLVVICIDIIISDLESEKLNWYVYIWEFLIRVKYNFVLCDGWEYWYVNWLCFKC